MMNNKLSQLLGNKNENLLTVYFTAGYPSLNDTAFIIKKLEAEKVDIIEVGIPYSDPLADGTTIQETGQTALKNGMNLDLLFKQLEEVKTANVPLILMGYFNQFLQYGPEKFLDNCKNVNVSGLILPDMPLEVYDRKYKRLFTERNISISFLITPRTSNERIKLLAEASTGFLYIVSSSSTTGNASGISKEQIAYFERIKALNLPNTKQIGFGISDKETFQTACSYSNGAIIGSAFLNALKGEDLDTEIENFISAILS